LVVSRVLNSAAGNKNVTACGWGKRRGLSLGEVKKNWRKWVNRRLHSAIQLEGPTDLNLCGKKP